MSNRPTVWDATCFIINHRRKSAYKGWKPTEIINEIDKAFQRGEAECIFTADGTILALGTWKTNTEKKVVHVEHILSKPEFKHATSYFLENIFNTRYKGWSLTATRYNQSVDYTPKLARFQKLCKILTLI